MNAGTILECPCSLYLNIASRDLRREEHHVTRVGFQSLKTFPILG